MLLYWGSNGLTTSPVDLPLFWYFKKSTFHISARENHTWARIGGTEEKQASYFWPVALRNLCFTFNLIKIFGSLTCLDLCFLKEWCTFLASLFFSHCVSSFMCCDKVLWLCRIVDQPQNCYCEWLISFSFKYRKLWIQYSRPLKHVPNFEHMSNPIKVNGISQRASSEAEVYLRCWTRAIKETIVFAPEKYFYCCWYT